MIAILLEGRLDSLQWTGRGGSIFVHRTRIAALFGGTASTLGALMITGGCSEHEFADWMISISGAALFLAFALMLGAFLGLEALHLIRSGNQNDTDGNPALKF